jgi:hypothetical protein
MSASMSNQVDNVIVFPGQVADRYQPATGRELRTLSEQLHLLSGGLSAILPHSGWTARQWMIASTQFRMRSAGTRDRLARLAGTRGDRGCAVRRTVEIGYTCLEADRALQVVDGCLEGLMGTAADSRAQVQLTREFMTSQSQALAAMNDLRLIIAREVSGARCS